MCIVCHMLSRRYDEIHGYTYIRDHSGRSMYCLERFRENVSVAILFMFV